MWISSRHPAPSDDECFRVIEDNHFGILVTHGERGFNETHLPFLLRRNTSPPTPRGTLDGHFARANDQWKDFAAGAEAVAIFTGPHGYISPTWYEPRDKPYVPTWNYVAVHVRGAPVLLDDEAAWDVVSRTVRKSESGRDPEWRLEASHDYARKILGGIVAFTMEITSWDAQFKLSQDKPTDLRERVVEALGPDDPLAEEMTAALRRDRAT